MESITQEREREMTPPTNAAERKSHSSNSLGQQRKSADKQITQTKKRATAQQK